jgi:hypothetical protein
VRAVLALALWSTVADQMIAMTPMIATKLAVTSMREGGQSFAWGISSISLLLELLL